MPPHRRNLTPDTRPDWRDPDMPVLLNCTDTITKQPYLGKYIPERAQQAFATRMQMGNAPTFDNDPTYNLRRKR